MASCSAPASATTSATPAAATTASRSPAPRSSASTARGAPRSSRSTSTPSSRCSRSRPQAPVLAAEAALAAVTAGPAGDTSPAGGPADQTIAARITAFIAEHYDQPLRLAALADAARVSPHHACRAFRRATGRTIHAHHEDVRLRHALALVLDTERPLAEVAAATGFANQGHLGNRFRRRFGTSPGRARRTGVLR